MPASSILSAIAPVVGAASASIGAEGQDVSAEFAAVLSEAGETETASAPDAAATPPAQPSPKAETLKTASAAALVFVLEDGAPDATSLEAPPLPVVETDTAAIPDEPETKAETAQPAQDADPAVVAQTGLLQAPVVVASQAVPAPQAAAEPAGTESEASAAPPPANDAPADDAPALASDAKPAAPAAVEAAAAKASQAAAKASQAAAATPAPLQPIKAEPLRPTSASRNAQPHTPSAETASPASDASKAGPATTGVADSQASRATGTTAQSPLPAPAKTLEAVSAPRPEPAAFNAPASETAAPAVETAPAAPAVVASTLSRATIETTVHIAAQIAHRLEGKQTRFDMVLTPEDLGRVEVSLDIDADGRLAARLAFDNPAAAADLRGRADELRRQLTDAGFQLTGDSLEFSERDSNAFSGGAFDRGQDRAFSFAGGKRLGDQADQAAARPAAWINLSLTPDRVDMRV